MDLKSIAYFTEIDTKMSSLSLGRVNICKLMKPKEEFIYDNEIDINIESKSDLLWKYDPLLPLLNMDHNYKVYSIE